ncbi:acyloxyacyl hydrolase [Algimonas porphyrae]|uniref:Deacylase n=1 Tax=Algimonas porphyrae TaxID=1128113 RepID=A0ABQ5UZS8_9PROT|nr:acyloxyacyl hydrolase [Algimonas porphyrae]GLQ19934.1 deacylase [Algimonas porphyrae]
MKHLLLSAAIVLGLSVPASAQIAELRAGVTEHDVQIFGLGSDKGKENSAAIHAEILFEEPEFLKRFLSPQPWVGGTLNLGGRTSYGGAGFLFRQTFGERFYGDWSTGLVIHDGVLETDLPPLFTDPNFPLQTLLTNPSALTPDQLRRAQVENAEYAFRLDNEIEFGSRVLFRNAFALGVRFNDTWAGEAFVEHLSHGKILSSGPNEGLDAYGFRLAYRFD